MYLYVITLTHDTVAEWLRRRPAKPLGFARVGSNPIGVVTIFFTNFFFQIEIFFLWSHPIHWLCHGLKKKFFFESLLFQFNFRGPHKYESLRNTLTSSYDHTILDPPDSHLNSEVKQDWAYLVLWWGTTRES